MSNLSTNTTSPSFELRLEHLLSFLPPAADSENEYKMTLNTIRQKITLLKRIYEFYSCLGHEYSPDNTYLLNRLQFYRFAKDCKIHLSKSLMEIDRFCGSNQSTSEIHLPYAQILFREFVNMLVAVAYLLYHKQFVEDKKAIEETGILSGCLDQLITINILPHACLVRGYGFVSQQNAETLFPFLSAVLDVYQENCCLRQESPFDRSMRMRDFLTMLRDLKLLNATGDRSKDLTSEIVVRILAIDDKRVLDEDGYYNLDIEMSYLEFLEALVGCSQVFVTDEMLKMRDYQGVDDVLKQALKSASSQRFESNIASRSGHTATASLISPHGLDEMAAAVNSSSIPDKRAADDGHLATTAEVGLGGGGQISEIVGTNDGIQAQPFTDKQSHESPLVPLTNDAVPASTREMPDETVENASDDPATIPDLAQNHILDDEANDIEKSEPDDDTDEESEPDIWAKRVECFFEKFFLPAAKK